jgi:hypothetical protein
VNVLFPEDPHGIGMRSATARGHGSGECGRDERAQAADRGMRVHGTDTVEGPLRQEGERRHLAAVHRASTGGCDAYPFPPSRSVVRFSDDPGASGRRKRR